MHKRIIVRTEWDDDAGVWSANCDDIHGLSVAAPTLEMLTKKAERAVLSHLIASGELARVRSFDIELRKTPGRASPQGNLEGGADGLILEPNGRTPVAGSGGTYQPLNQLKA